jgi:hypothetical protein
MLNNKKQSGQIIIIALVVLAVLLTFSTALVGYTTLDLRAERDSYVDGKALMLAEAGIEKAIYEMNQNASYNGETETVLDDGEFTITLADIDPNTKEITSTGYYPNSTNPLSTRIVKVQVNIDSSTVSFNFGVQVGAGGLTMDNNSGIAGNVFANGNISGSGTVSGSATVAGGSAITPEQSWQNQNTDFNFGNTSSRVNAAQRFIAGESGALSKVKLFLKKTGSPNNLTLRILTDSNGSPTKTSIADGTIASSLVTSNYSFIEGTFQSLPTLTAGQAYWILLIASNNSSNYFSWGLDNTDAYASGTGKYSSNWNANNPVWNNAGGDFNFQTFMGTADTYLTGVNVAGDARAHSLSSCTINGNAYYSSVNTCTVGGTLNSNQPDEAPQPMPISDAQIQEWREKAEEGGVLNGTQTVNGTQTLGPVRINGDLNVYDTLILSGPVWVKGNINFDNNAILQVSPALGNAGTVLLADNPDNMSGSGMVTVTNNVVFSGNGSSTSFPMIVGTNTSSQAMVLRNNVEGAIFYSANGTIDVSNNVQAKQLTGYSISLSNNATITYTNGLANATFANGPGGSWAYLSGSYVIVK